MTGVEVIIKIFCQRYVKCFLEAEGQGKHFTNRAQNYFNDDRWRHLPFVFLYLTTRTKKINKLFQRKNCNDFNVAAQCCPRRQHWSVNVLARATLCKPICKCHEKRCGPIACKYFALRYNSSICFHKIFVKGYFQNDFFGFDANLHVWPKNLSRPTVI